MKLLSEIYNVTLKRGNREANKNGWIRPTIGECYVTHKDFQQISNRMSYQIEDTGISYDSGIWHRSIKIGNNKFLTAKFARGSNPTFSTYSFNATDIYPIDSYIDTTTGISCSEIRTVSEPLQIDTFRFLIYHYSGRLYDIFLNTDGTINNVNTHSVQNDSDGNGQATDLVDLGNGYIGILATIPYSGGGAKLNLYTYSYANNTISAHNIQELDSSNYHAFYAVCAAMPGNYFAVAYKSYGSSSTTVILNKLNGADVSYIAHTSFSEDGSTTTSFGDLIFTSEGLLVLSRRTDTYENTIFLFECSDTALTKKLTKVAGSFGNASGVLRQSENGKLLLTTGRGGYDNDNKHYILFTLAYTTDPYALDTIDWVIFDGSPSFDDTYSSVAVDFCLLDKDKVLINDEDVTKIISINGPE